jgi:tripartite-type tricarboxylate transporter receptor subunit TctC
LGFDVEFYIWSGFFAPRAVPPEAIKVLREATQTAVNSAEFRNAMEKMETPIAYLDADEFQKFWYKDAARLAIGIKNIGRVQ